MSLRAAAQRIDSMTIRERVILFVASLGLLYAAWDFALFAPLDAERGVLLARIERLEQEAERLNAQARAMVTARAADPDGDAHQRLARLRAEADEMQAALSSFTASLVPPREMARLIESLLDRDTRLRLVRLEGLGTQRVSAEPDAESPIANAATDTDARAPALFRHGLRIELEGGYLETLAYLTALEALSWDFLWDAVRFEVQAYPSARVTITVYSLSLDDAWIGV